MSAIAAGTQAPAAPAPAPNGAAKPNGTPPAGQPVAPEAPKAPEPFRFKRELKIDGRVVPVDLDENSLTRELVVGRAAQKRYDEAQKRLAAAQQFDELLARDPRAALKLKGHDFDNMLLTEAQRHAQMSELTPEQQRIAELEHQLQQREMTEKQRAEQAKQQAEAQRRQRTQQRTRSVLFESLKHVGFPIDGPENAHFRGQALKMAAKLQRHALKHTGVELEPQQLGAAVQRRYVEGVTRTAALTAKVPEFRKAHGPILNQLMQTMTDGLEGQALLEAMGPKLVRSLIKAQSDALAARGGHVVGGTASSPAGQPSWASQQRPPNQPPPGLDPYAHKKKW